MTFSVLLLSLLFAMQPSVNANTNTTATIDLSKEKQIIRGFGGINHPVWIGDLTPSQRETAFGNGAKKDQREVSTLCGARGRHFGKMGNWRQAQGMY